jgi:alginate O-acetyltransferase complex protein AlgJ
VRPSMAVALCLLLAVSAGTVLVTVGLTRTDGAGTNDTSIWDGSMTQVIDAEIEERFGLRKLAVRVIAVLRYTLLRSGSPGVVVGRDGWLYTEEELMWREEDATTAEVRMEYVERVADVLSSDGVSLLVVLLPSKARVVDEPLADRYRTLANHPRYETALRRWRSLEIPVVDARPYLEALVDTGEIPFFARDTHWTPAGVAAVARGVAAEARQHNLIVGPQRTEFVTEPGEPLLVIGDLMQYVPVGRFAEVLGLGEEHSHQTITRASSPPEVGLFDTPEIPVTVVGTSYTADPRWNFDGLLKEALSLDVLKVAERGAGPFEPMAAYLSGATYREILPSLIIWEIPERYLTIPDASLPPLM